MSNLSPTKGPKRVTIMQWSRISAIVVAVCVFSGALGVYYCGFDVFAAPPPTSSQAATKAESGEAAGEELTPEERIRRIEAKINSIKMTTEMAEIRSYQNKMMGRELVRLVKAAVVVLVLIGVGFPLILLILSYKRVLGPPGLSPEVASTLLEVEERQAKLTNILRDIQSEVDYLHSMSVPDLRRLIEQAESYIEQNERDLARTDEQRRKHEGESSRGKPQSET